MNVKCQSNTKMELEYVISSFYQIESATINKKKGEKRQTCNCKTHAIQVQAKSTSTILWNPLEQVFSLNYYIEIRSNAIFTPNTAQ